MVALPLHPRLRPRPGALVLVLPVEQRIQGEGAAPLQPPRGGDVVSYVRLHVHRPRVFLPWPAQESRDRPVRVRQVAARHHPAPLDGRAGVLVRVRAALCRHGVLLPGHSAARHKLAVLDDHGGVAKDEVNGAGDGAVAEELPQGVGVEGVLVALDLAAIDDGLIGADA